MRLLVVDDDGVSRKVACSIASRLGHEVTAAEGGPEAQALLESRAFDIVITDWVMPGVDGLDLCEWIRAHPDRPFTYVMLVTQRRRTDDVVTGILSGADDFISKPYAPAELKARLHAAERMVGVARSVCPSCYERSLRRRAG